MNWVLTLSCFFTVLILALSLLSSLWVKDKINRILTAIAFSGLYSFILGGVFNQAYIGFMEGDIEETLIFSAFSKNLFFGTIYQLFTLIILVCLLVRVFIIRKRSKKP
ncbi:MULTISPECIES: hypothetical protein [Acinetobacter]|uniref:Uncharacterized protein n=2 Tax=Acinetobacter TaxID=469 RepID=N8W9Y9_9GAMM|nr:MULTISPECIES: hypothetical protein [Acinetobacter]ENU92117.1 hypothetical protein F971_02004 [Acinetobacter vivianii]ENW92732.1 hypothetical protein F904_02675 [Acinetobacter dispersus]